MKRLYSLIMMAAMICLPMFADSYRNTMKEYMLKSNVINTDQYVKLMEPLAESFFADDIEMGKTIIGRYIEEQMMEDITDMYLPLFRKHVSEAELKELIKTYSDPRYGRVQEHASKILSTMDQTEEYQMFTTKYQEALVSIMQGGTAEDVKPTMSVSGEYARVFNQYYVSSGTKQMVTNMFSSMTDMLENMLISYGYTQSEAKKVMKQVTDYSDRNLPVMLMSIFNRNLTLRDLQDLNEISATTPYKHAMEAVNDASTDVMQLGIDLISHMADWMDKKYPKYAKGVRQRLEETRRILGK